MRRCEKAYARGAATGAPPVRHFLEACIEWLEADLAVKLEEYGPNQSITGRAPHWITWVERAGPSTCAYLTLKAALNGHANHPSSQASPRSLRTVCRILMGMLADEQRANAFIEQDAAAYANAVNRASSAPRQRSIRIRKRAKFHGIALPPTPGNKEATHVGAHLLMAMCQSTGAFTIDRRLDYTKRPPRPSLVLTPTVATLEWIATRSDRLRLTMPIHPPTLIPPRDWGRGEGGGYHYSLAQTLPLVRHCSPAQSLKLSSADMPLVYSALNALQRTPWRVNTRVADIVGMALDGRLPNLIPGPHSEVIPPYPPKGSDPTVLRDWRIRAAELHMVDDQRRSKRGDAERAVVVADQLRDSERFYYPYSLDFRGRAYPATEFLHPHGPDVVRGMLEFADGVPLTKRGAGWLAVHGANCLGAYGNRKLSKLNFQERVDVIKEITPRILSVAEDPIGRRDFWGEAEEPWQFLAFCYEWAEWVNTGSLESHVPVGLDGTANGLQHYSAMLRDPVGAAAVNMTSTDRPSDIYAVVAEAVLSKLGESVNEPIASLWLASGLVTRSIVKRPVMTLPYGATRYGFVDQILQTLRGDDKTWQTARKVFGLAHVRIRVAVQYLSSIIWDVLGDTVGGALGAMSWLQKASAAVSSQTGGPVAWTVPLTGFPAHQEYFKARRSQIETRLNGTVLKPTVWTATNKPNTAKIKNAIAPNIVHSLDAAAMMATTVACAARGVPAFSMIHDSYAVHAECVPVLADCIRTSFIDLYYGREVLLDLQREWTTTGAELPDPPGLGVFDVREVRHASFFFA